VLFDRRSTIVSVGSGLQAALQYADVIGSPVSDVFTLTRPLIDFNLSNVRNVLFRLSVTSTLTLTFHL